MQIKACNTKLCRTGDGQALLFRRISLVCAITLGLAFAVGECYAAQQSLLNLTGLRQWADLSYQYNGSSTSSDSGQSRSSQQNRFMENYHAGLNYTIYNRRLLNGYLDLDLGANQSLTSESNVDSGGGSSGSDIEFKAGAVILSNSPIPVNIHASSQKKHVQNPFSRSYDLDSDTFGVSLVLKNSYLPARISYNSYGSQTDGLSLDRKQAIEALSFGVNNTYKELSRTELHLSRSSDSTDYKGRVATQSTDSVELNVRNSLTLRPMSGEGSLDSSYQHREELGSRQSVSSSWNEDIKLRLGKALQAGFGYSYSNDENLTQSKVQNKTRGWMQHRLFQSLTTRLEFVGSENNYSSGSERNSIGSLNIAYNKKLPSDSSIQLGFTQSHGITDRSIASQQLVEIGEPLTVGLFDNFLKQADIDPDSIVVYNKERTQIFQKGNDYAILPPRPGDLKTELQFPASSPIKEGDVLSIDYLYRVSGDIKYSTDNRSLSASLSLFQKLLKFNAGFSDSNQKILSGFDDTASLNPSQSINFGIEATLPKMSFGSTYTNQNSTINKFQTIEGRARYEHVMGSSSLQLRLNESYRMYEQVKRVGISAGSSGADNSLNLGADYRKPIGRYANLTLTGNYLNLIGESRTRNDIAFGLNYDLRYGKFEAIILSSVSWHLNPGAIDRADYLYIKLRRYF